MYYTRDIKHGYICIISQIPKCVGLYTDAKPMVGLNITVTVKYTCVFHMRACVRVNKLIYACQYQLNRT